MKHYQIQIITEPMMGEDAMEITIQTTDIEKATAFLAYWSEQ